VIDPVTKSTTVWGLECWPSRAIMAILVLIGIWGMNVGG
jgi:hypothetical protein